MKKKRKRAGKYLMKVPNTFEWMYIFKKLRLAAEPGVTFRIYGSGKRQRGGHRPVLKDASHLRLYLDDEHYPHAEVSQAVVEQNNRLMSELTQLKSKLTTQTNIAESYRKRSAQLRDKVTRLEAAVRDLTHQRDRLKEKGTTDADAPLVMECNQLRQEAADLRVKVTTLVAENQQLRQGGEKVTVTANKDVTITIQVKA